MTYNTYIKDHPLSNNLTYILNFIDISALLCKRGTLAFIISYFQGPSPVMHSY